MINGIDVSDFQTVEWPTVKAAGYSWGYAKATEGTDDAQRSFPGRLVSAQAAGLDAGAYHFMTWDEDPQQQLDNFLANYIPKSGDLAPMLDCEEDTNAAPGTRYRPKPSEVVGRMAVFLDGLTARLGNDTLPLIYGPREFIEAYLGGGDFAGHPLWIAEYHAPPPPTSVDGFERITIWQHTGNGQIAGITDPNTGLPTEVDLSYFLGDSGALAKLRLP
jgi:GH25 family lysozyme M1 (1,4-beta-N-acetylmuramidase)